MGQALGKHGGHPRPMPATGCPPHRPGTSLPQADARQVWETPPTPPQPPDPASTTSQPFSPSLSTALVQNIRLKLSCFGSLVSHFPLAWAPHTNQATFDSLIPSASLRADDSLCVLRARDSAHGEQVLHRSIFLVTLALVGLLGGATFQMSSYLQAFLPNPKPLGSQSTETTSPFLLEGL